jgi:hypothetical protein
LNGPEGRRGASEPLANRIQRGTVPKQTNKLISANGPKPLATILATSTSDRALLCVSWSVSQASSKAICMARRIVSGSNMGHGPVIRRPLSFEPRVGLCRHGQSAFASPPHAQLSKEGRSFGCARATPLEIGAPIGPERPDAVQGAKSEVTYPRPAAPIACMT